MLGESPKNINNLYIITNNNSDNSKNKPVLKPTIEIKARVAKKRKTIEESGNYTPNELKVTRVLRTFPNTQRAKTFELYLKNNGIVGCDKLANLSGIDIDSIRNIIIHGQIPTHNQNKKIIENTGLDLILMGHKKE
ncbi:MAG: hypothetical protein KC550_01165 [Nanoarchaeota archaeon]|nr:hypothetical protein [Nanoarchaeota archaeon]